MSDENRRPELTLGAALRTLPMQSPNGDVWVQLSAQLTPPVRQRRVGSAWPTAIAACMLLAIAAWFVSMYATRTATIASSSSSSVDNATTETADVNATNATTIQLTALQSRSRELEQWLHTTADSATPLPGNDLAAAGEIESLIGVVDLELTAPQQHDVEKLWRRRVNLLEDLTTLRYSNYRMAENTAAVNAGQPGTWIN